MSNAHARKHEDVTPARPAALRDTGPLATPEALEAARQFVRAHRWWQTAVFAIGLLTLVIVFSVLFLGVDNGPRDVRTSGPLAPVDSSQFAQDVASLVNAPIEHGGTVQIIDNGDAFVPALLRDIGSARRTINFLVYIWEDGTFSNQVIDALIERQQHGVAVRVLLDGLGGRKAPDDRFEMLRRAGGRVERYRTPRFGTVTRFHRRNHRRSIVVDGEVGYVGGMAISDKWLGHAQDPDHWRDMMFRVTGPLARSLQTAFVGSWVSTSGEILVGPSIYASTAPAAPGVDRFIQHVNSPADDDQSMAYFYLMPILAAREKVYLATPYFIPDEPLRKALEKKAREGVDVRLLLPGRHIDNKWVRYSGQNHYDELMQAGVRIYEYQPTFIHSKFAVFDGKWSIIGSPNLNSRSRQLDEENAFGIFDLTLGRQLEQTFFRDLGQSEEIQLDAWRKRNPFRRLLQEAATLLDEQS
jgi:cardiolipin synthase A/B